MGVTGLWDLLAPCARRISLDVLARKRLAVDASIWLIQFIKAMRDDRGEMVPNAPVLGLFRRVCKLMFLHIKPVIVFDGTTPELKLRTLAARRAIRDRQQQNLKKTAEKVLLHQLKHSTMPRTPPCPPTSAAAAGLSSAAGPSSGGPSSAAAPPSATGPSGPSGPAEAVDLDEPRAVLFDADPAEAPLSSGIVTLEDMLEAARRKRNEAHGGKGKVIRTVPVASANSIAGQIVLPRNGPVDEHVITSLPAELQYEVLHEIKYSERTKRRDSLVRAQRSVEDFSRTQLKNYVAISNIASRIDRVRTRLNGDDGAKRVASAPGRDYVLVSQRRRRVLDDGEEEGEEPEPERQATMRGEGSDDDHGHEERAAPLRLNNPFPQTTAQRKRPMGHALDETAVFLDAQGNAHDTAEAAEQEDVALAQALSMSLAGHGDRHGEPEPVEIDLAASDDDDDSGDDDLAFAIGGGASAVAEHASDWRRQAKKRLYSSERGVDTLAATSGAADAPASAHARGTGWASAGSGFMVDGALASAAAAQGRPPAPDWLLKIRGDDTWRLPEAEAEAEDGDRALDAEEDPEDVSEVIDADDDPDVEEARRLPLARPLPSPRPELLAQAAGDSPPREPPPSPDRPRAVDSSAPAAVPATPSQPATTPAAASRAPPRAPARTPSGGTVTFFPAGTVPPAREDMIALQANEAAEALEAVDNAVHDRDLERLREAQRRQARDADAVTSEMIDDCKELLALFGIPVVEAPSEAEAQCAAMELAGLVDGICTSDSDVLLFGGRRVYRHLFDEKQFVEVLDMADVEAELALVRDDLIDMALLLGSDYTEGVRGVGIVNASEVVSAFRTTTAADGGRGVDLKAFHAWATSLADDDEVTAADNPRRRAFRTKHRQVRRNWVFPDGFPSARVRDAYCRPAVDLPPARDDGEPPLRWGLPDVAGLRAFCASKFGWAQSFTDAELSPVLAKLAVTHSQQRIDGMFTFETRFAKFASSRLHKAMSAIARTAGAGDDDDDGEEETVATPTPASQRKRKPKRKRPDTGHGAAKRPPSSFLLFSSANRAAVKEENPGAAPHEVARLLGQRWRELAAAARDEFTVAAQRLRQEYADHEQRPLPRGGGLSASDDTESDVAADDDGDDVPPDVEDH